MPTESLEELQRQWWAQWWRRDYSWDGLAKKRVSGWYVDNQGAFTRARGTGSSFRPLYLQDVWRDQADRLIPDEQGRRWTVVHAPLVWQNGAPAKSTWAGPMWEVADAAIRTAAARFPVEPERPRPRGRLGLLRPVVMLPRAKGIPLDGAILPILPQAVADMEYVRGDDVATVALLLKGVRGVYLRRCLFEEGLELSGIKDGRDIRLFASLFAGDFKVINVTVDRLRLGKLQIFGRVLIDSVKAADRVNLPDLATQRGVVLQKIESPGIGFTRGRISGDFELNEIKGSLDLENLKVDGDLKAVNLTLQVLTAAGLEVTGKAVFTDLVATESADFSESVWGRNLSFFEAQLTQLMFENAEFAGKAWFDDAVFTGPVSFSDSHFHNVASFRAVDWDGEGADHAGAFRQARFDSFVDFQTPRFEAFSAFSGAHFKGEIRFLRTLFADDSRVHRLLRLAKTDAAKVDLEYGFRALKQAAEVVRDRNLEQAFFRYELLARRSQLLTPVPERVLSRSYGLVSNYGASFVRPAMAAAALWVGFVLVYLLLAQCSGANLFRNLTMWGDPPHPAWAAVVDLSTRSMFNLFGVWSLRPPTGPALSSTQAIEVALLHSSPLIGVLTRLASSIQSIFAGVLLFLVALAARRRFQIS